MEPGDAFKSVKSIKQISTNHMLTRTRERLILLKSSVKETEFVEEEKTIAQARASF
jgi:hypothetical protein